MTDAPDRPAQRAVRLAVIGAGMIGRQHIRHIANEDCARLAAVVDPAPAAAALAEAHGAAWYPSLAAMLARDRPEGVIVATPNTMHVANGLDCVAAGIAVLVEKPIADDVAGATLLVEAAEAAGVPLLVGHHRRHNPLVQEAARTIREGRLGRLVAVHGTCWFHKPDSYFEAAWRREKGAGPVLMNLIHDIDLLRCLCGEVAAVQAMESRAVRCFAVEDTAVVLLRFASGVLGTLSVSDTLTSPWSWELTSGENPAYNRAAESCTMIGGTLGSLTIPYLDLWHNPGKPGWMEPVAPERLAVTAADPLALQVRNLCGVVRGTAAATVPGREGLNTLKVIAAISRAAASGKMVGV